MACQRAQVKTDKADQADGDARRHKGKLADVELANKPKDRHPLARLRRQYSSGGSVARRYGPSTFCRTLFQIERAALHSYGSDPHSC